jgi:hypothetical protein
MKKFSLVLGGVVGFVLGSRAGREPYDLLVERLRQVSARPPVQSAVETAKEKAGEAAAKVSSKAHAAKDTGNEKLDEAAAADRSY